MTQRIISLLALTAVATSCPAQSVPRQITKLKPLHLETSLGTPGSPRASIVAGPELRALGETLQQQIEQRAGIRLPLVSDRAALRDLARCGNIIALGHYGNNKVLERFYYRWYLVVDGIQPGAGGYVLETVHNPDALGVNLIVVGGSDRPGVAKSAACLIKSVEKCGSVLPRLFEVELGAGKAIVEERGRAALAPDRVWPTNQMNVQEALGEAAMLYVYTADEAYAALFKTKLMEWLEKGARDNALDDFWRVIISWDLVEEAPVLSDEERLWITNMLWDEINLLCPKCETYVFSRKDTVQPRKNHGARSALSVYFAARYFWQYYRIAEMKQWLADVRTYWEPQMTCFMAMEGTTQAIATLMPATAYALAEDIESFLSRDVLGRIADKPLLRVRKLGATSYYLPYGNYAMLWWSLAAHLFDAPEYLRPILRKYGSLSALRFPSRGVRELGRSFWDGRLPSAAAHEKAPSEWLRSMPLAGLYHAKVFAHGPRNVPYDKAFDFLVFRDPQGQDQQYLAVEGDNAGSYSFDTANAITMFSSRGLVWLDDGPWGVKTTRKVSSVSIVRDGEGQPMPAFARLERADATTERGITRTGMVGYNGTDWYRNIINVPNKWFLVIDEITVQEPGDYVIESRWATPARCGFDGDDVVASQADPTGQPVLFRITGTGWESQYLIPKLYRDFLASPPHRFPPTAGQLSPLPCEYRTVVARRWAGRMTKGQTHVFANLFYVQPDHPAPLYKLQALAERRYLVGGAGQNWLAHVDESGKWLLGEAGELAVPAEATRPGAPALDLKPVWQRCESARILSAAAMSVTGGSRYAVGLADGRIRLRTEEGDGAVDCSTSGNVHALCAVDLDGDGSDELVAGSDTGGVRVFAVDGRQLWAWTPPPWERPSTARIGRRAYRTVITGIRRVDIDADGLPEILAMGVSWYVIDRQGRTLFVHEVRNSGRSWDGIVYEQTFLLAAGDVLGDGADEIVGDLYGMGNAGGCSLVHVWDGKADKPQWLHSRPTNRFAGSALKAVMAADVDGDGKDEFAIASDAYRLQLGYYDYGPKNRTVWYCSVGSGANALMGADLDGDGRAEIVVGTEMGQVQAFDAQKRRRFVADVGQSVTALAARPCRAGSEIWVGTVNGKLLVLDAEGRTLRRGHLPGLIDSLAASKGGAVLAATSGGHVALYHIDDAR